MPLTQMRRDFEALKKARKHEPKLALTALGRFGHDAIEVLRDHTTLRPFAFKGFGEKVYDVAALPGTGIKFSRAINRNLFIPDPSDFEVRWAGLMRAVATSADSGILADVDAAEVDRVIYSAVIGYAASVDLFAPGDRGGPGSYLEMVVGPIIALITGRPERSAIKLPVPETGEYETVTTDLSFDGTAGDPVLVVPTKISTRERIVQPFVHQLILDRSREVTGIVYRSALIIGNENNTMFPKGLAAADKTFSVGWTQETLVPGTIVLYQKYVAELAGLYYLDPPNKYLHDAPTVFPRVATLGGLLTQDLPDLLK